MPFRREKVGIGMILNASSAFPWKGAYRASISSIRADGEM